MTGAVGRTLPRAATRSAEWAFVLACVGSGGRVGVPGGLDGETLAAIARRHQVVPLVVETIRRAEAPVPPALAARFAPIRPLLSAREAVRLHALLAADGLEPVFLKGSTLAVLAYGALHRRQFGDIDVLVRPDELVRATALLVQAGYRPEVGLPEDLPMAVDRRRWLAKDVVLHHPGNGQVVELHWRLTDNPWARSPLGSERLQEVALFPGVALPTLATEALFAYLCAHGAAHCWARLRWLADIAALLAATPDGGDRLWRGAVARRQGRSAASAILLCQRLFGTPPPPAFGGYRSVRLAVLVRVSGRVIEAGGGTTEHAHTRWRGWAETLAKLLVASGPGDLAGWILRLLYSSVDREVSGGSRVGYVLLPLLRIPRLIARRRARGRAERARKRA